MKLKLLIATTVMMIAELQASIDFAQIDAMLAQPGVLADSQVEEKTILLGKTGAAKTTLLKYLVKSTPLKVEMNEDGDPMIIEEIQMPAGSRFKIGTTGGSETRYPQMLRIHGTAFFDTPGYLETRDINHEIVTAFLRTKLMHERYGAVKIILVVEEQDLAAHALKRIITMFHSLLPQWQKMLEKNAVGLVITKSICENSDKILSHFHTQISQVDVPTDNIFSALLDTGKYAFFHEPTIIEDEGGQMITELPKNREVIMQFIRQLNFFEVTQYKSYLKDESKTIIRRVLKTEITKLSEAYVYKIKTDYSDCLSLAQLQSLANKIKAVKIKHALSITDTNMQRLLVIAQEIYNDLITKQSPLSQIILQDFLKEKYKESMNRKLQDVLKQQIDAIKVQFRSLITPKLCDDLIKSTDKINITLLKSKCQDLIAFASSNGCHDMCQGIFDAFVPTISTAVTEQKRLIVSKKRTLELEAQAQKARQQRQSQEEADAKRREHTRVQAILTSANQLFSEQKYTDADVKYQDFLTCDEQYMIIANKKHVILQRKKIDILLKLSSVQDKIFAIQVSHLSCLKKVQKLKQEMQICDRVQGTDRQTIRVSCGESNVNVLFTLDDSIKQQLENLRVKLHFVLANTYFEHKQYVDAIKSIKKVISYEKMIQLKFRGYVSQCKLLLHECYYKGYGVTKNEEKAKQILESIAL